MPRTATRWRDLVPGLVALTLLVASTLAVLLFARVGTLRGEKFDVVVLASQAHDIDTGTEVWLAGQRVGTVTGVDFRPPSVDTAGRLAVHLELLERARPLLTRDAQVRFTAGSSLLGSRVVALSPGTADAPQLVDDDTLRARPDRDLRSLVGTFADVGDQLPQLRSDVNQIVSSLRSTESSLGAITRGEGLATVGRLQSSLVSLTRQLSGTTDGSLGPMLRSPEIRSRVGRATARADSVRLLLSSDAGTLGRFRRDSTLAAQVAAVRDEVSIVRALLDLPAGSAGRALHDGAIVAELRELERELELLIEDVKSRPLRYVVF